MSSSVGEQWLFLSSVLVCIGAFSFGLGIFVKNAVLHYLPTSPSLSLSRELVSSCALVSSLGMLIMYASTATVFVSIGVCLIETLGECGE